VTTVDPRQVCRQILEANSKSFALASRLLPAGCRDDAAAVYAWCRRVDDAIDLCAPQEQPAALETLRSELSAVYAGAPQDQPVLQAFQQVVHARGIPRQYPAELLAGMEMDVLGHDYETMDALLLYCYRVAGVVGLMMSHVMGLTDAAALRRAAHLGMAMQLTNICRDVAEDWALERLYVPGTLLASGGAAWLPPHLGTGVPLPEGARQPLAHATRSLLAEADRYYRSGELGVLALHWRCALAIRAARHVYAAIGTELARREHDVLRGRAVVSTARKLLHVARALGQTLLDVPRRLFTRAQPVPLPAPVSFPHDVLPV
jgi:phytoene synthase